MMMQGVFVVGCLFVCFVGWFVGCVWFVCGAQMSSCRMW